MSRNSERSAKAELYRFVRSLKIHLGDSLYGPPYNVIRTVKQIDRIDLQYQPFSTDGFCGLAFKGDKKDTIILNSNRDALEQNFDCAHEMIHLFKHRNKDIPYFQCFKTAKPMQNRFLEWQANEGAAEYLMPHDKVLEYIGGFYYDLDDFHNISILKACIAHDFKVTDAMVRIRLENLKYEISQYMFGIELPDIEILSDRQQQDLGLHVKSLNEIEFDGINREFNAYFDKKEKREVLQIDSNCPEYIKWEDGWLFPNG